METLYDLLGALPRDDAEELRSAFRRAVKGAHPDIHPGDPLAGQKFREIVRANEILGDEDQRSAYDHLLDLAHKEQKQEAAAKAMHKAATSVMALVIVAGLGVGGYIGVQYSPAFSGTLKSFAEVALVRPGDFASLPATTATAQPAPAMEAKAEAVAEESKPSAAPPDAKVLIAAAEPPPSDKAPTATEAIAPIPVATIAVPPPAEPETTATTIVGPPLEIAPGDPKAYRERGIFAYRNGDLDGAIAEFDRAIKLDPKSSAAYVDRSIVLYRLQKFERAFADIAQAKRLEKANHAKTAQTATAKKQKQQTTTPPGFTPFFQRHTARLEATTP